MYRQCIAVALLLAFSAASLSSAQANSATEQETYLALGDSITAGVDLAPGERTPYAERVAASEDYELTNLGVSGWDSTDLLRALRHREGFRASVRHADHVTIYVGTNDLLGLHLRYIARGDGRCSETTKCLRRAVNRFHEREAHILQAVSNLRRGDMENVKVVTVYQPLVSFERSRAVKPYYDALNNRLTVLAERKGASVAEIRPYFNSAGGMQDGVERGMILDRPPDGVHPTDRGHERIASAII